MSITATKSPAASNNPRPLSVIAREIRTYWPNMSVHARPYANAMMSLDAITDDFYNDSAQSVVLYFLSNAATWRGDHAKRIKAELKRMVKANGYPI
jgi:hypothetical protein